MNLIYHKTSVKITPFWKQYKHAVTNYNARKFLENFAKLCDELNNATEYAHFTATSWWIVE